MGSRRDLFAECNLDGHPIELFQADCCAICVNPECSRSRAGTSKFDARTQNWEDRLFKLVPRMPAEDPRYPSLAGQRFITIDVSRTPEVRSAWVDPRDIVEPLPPEVPDPTLREDARPVPEGAAVTPQKETASRSSVPLHLMAANTPNPGGQMLQGAPASAIPTKDPWAAPVPTGEKILKPGSKVKLGGV